MLPIATGKYDKNFLLKPILILFILDVGVFVFSTIISYLSYDGTCEYGFILPSRGACGFWIHYLDGILPILLILAITVLIIILYIIRVIYLITKNVETKMLKK